MLLHLDRMRDMMDGWTRAIMAMQDKYKSRIKLADQDILNILFSFYPEKLYELPCEWNYSVWLCRQVRGDYLKCNLTPTNKHTLAG